MIVVKLIGGLGNQMFQYAAGRALALHRQTDLLLDTSFLEKDSKGAYTPRAFELARFNITVKIAGAKELESFDFNASRIAVKLKSYLPSAFNNLVFNESQPGFHPQFFKLPPNTYLNGYWQDDRYFSHIKEILNTEFTLKAESPGYKELLQNITSVNAVSLHVRRGDYAGLASAHKFHGLLSLSYYKEAIGFLEKKENNLHYFVFSDDIAWCEQNFDFLKNVTFINGHEALINSHEELLLMSHCKQNIIANSSFSWWAAWLNTSKNKTVIAPLRWFNESPELAKDLIPKEWKKI